MIFAEGLALPSPPLQPADHSRTKRPAALGDVPPAESWVTINNDISERLFHALVNGHKRSVRCIFTYQNSFAVHLSVRAN